MENINKADLEYRMYGLVPYNISDIQKGIQFGHAVVEYANLYSSTTPYVEWSRYDKTFIILNGGTTNKGTNLEDGLPFGELNKHELTISKKFPDLKFAIFDEPDLGDQLTAICFLVDERVWDSEKYPDREETDHLLSCDVWAKDVFNEVPSRANQIIELRNFLKQFKLA